MKKKQFKTLLADGYKEMTQEALKITREFDTLSSNEKNRGLDEKHLAEDMAEFKKLRLQEKSAKTLSSYLKKRKR